MKAERNKLTGIRNSKKVTIEKKTFPGYVLVRMDDDDNLLYEIRNTPSVIGFVGSGKYPAALSNLFICFFYVYKDFLFLCFYVYKY